MTDGASNQDVGHRVSRGYFDALASLDPDRMADLFADSGEIEDPVGTTVRRGRPAIADYWRNGLCAVASQVKIEILTALPAGNSIAVHWRMTAHARGGRTAEAEGIDVLQFDDHGLIVRAEGYWDQASFRGAIAG